MTNTDIYDEINNGHESVATIDSENAFYDYDNNAGFPVWLDDDTLLFMFSIRYSSEAFTGTWLQEDYRKRTHREFSSLIKDLITKKIENMRAMPELYENIEDHKRVFAPALIDKDNVIEIGESLGIDAGKIDVYTVLGDVTESLQKMLSMIIKERPGLTQAEKDMAVRFVDEQLWDDDTKMLWRGVSADELAKMYSYDNLPRSMKIIAQLDEYIRNEFEHGMYQHMDVKYAPVEDILSDAVIENVFNALADNDNADESEKSDDEWVISEAIAGSDDSWD